MNRFFVVILIVCLSQFHGYSQENINNYKYVIIPKQYEFQKSEDQYQLNSLTKFLFNKYGYTAYFQNEPYPSDLIANKCLAMTADIINLNGILTTKLQIELKDCNNNVIASSKVGKSKVKAYKKAFNLAIREAFETFQFFNYEYKENPDFVVRNQNNLTNEEKEIERLQKEVAFLKNKRGIESSDPKELSEKSIEEAAKQSKQNSIADITETLYAQPIIGGYQVVNTAPKKVMILLEFGEKNSFIVQGKDAIVYKKGDLWIYAEHDGKTLRTKALKLKF